MALSPDIEWEIRANGSATNGGGFLPGATGTDYSQQDTAQYALTAGSTAGASATVAHASASADMVGNVAYCSGTNVTATWYGITSVSVGVSITFEKNVTTGASSDIAMNIGGAVIFDSDALFEAMVPGNIGWVKQDGTHTLTGALVVANDGSANFPIIIEGYNSTRGDGVTPSNRPSISLGAFSNSFDDYWAFYHLEFTGTGVTMLDNDVGPTFFNCKITNSSGTSGRECLDLTQGSGAILLYSELSSTNGTAIQAPGSSGSIGHCYIHDCADEGLNMIGSFSGFAVYNTVIENCGTGINLGANNAQHCFTNVTIDDCTTGIKCSESGGSTSGKVRLGVNIIVSNCTTGLNWSSAASKRMRWNEINLYNNTTDKTNIGTVQNEIDTDPGYADAAGGDFTPGSAMDTGMPFPGGLSTKNPPLGAIPVDGGSVSAFMSGAVG